MAEAGEDIVTALMDKERAIRQAMADHRSAIGGLAEERREVLQALVDAIGMSETARRLNVSRQAVWNAINPPKN